MKIANWKVFLYISLVAGGMFCIIHADAPSVQNSTPWYIAGGVCLGIFVITALVGWMGQGKRG